MSVRSKPNREGDPPRRTAEPERDGSELPEGWAVAKLQDVGAWRSGGTPSRTKSEYFGQGVPWVKSGDLPDGPITKSDEQITQLGLDSSAAKLMPPGTICMALYGATIGKLGTMTFEAATNQATANLVPDERLVDGQYVFHYLMSERQNFIDLGQGGAQPNISQEIVRNHPIKLAPLAEQRRIVGKLELLLGKVSSNQQRLSRVPSLLKRFRQSVLAAACSGKLTADWREENDEPELDLDCDAIVAVEHLPSVPSTWTYRRAADIVAKSTVISYGMVLPGPNQPEGVPYIRGQDIDDSGNVHVDQLWKTTPLIAAKHRRSELLEGDVLLCVIRHLRVAIVPKGIDGANLTQGTVRLRPSSVILGPYLARYLASPQAQGWMKARYIGMAMPRINVEHARDVPIPLPPLSEQQEIVRRVEKLFAFADQIEARLRQAQAHVDRLTQSLLAKAFRGELVPTEHNLATAAGRDYEPASLLLARIHDEADTPHKTKSKRSLEPPLKRSKRKVKS